MAAPKARLTIIRRKRITELLAEIPGEIFWQTNGKANFNAIFVEVVRKIYGQPQGEDFKLYVRDLVNGKLPNIQTLMRSIAYEAKRRRDSGRGIVV